MYFLLGMVIGWLLIKQPEWAERQVDMALEKIFKKFG